MVSRQICLCLQKQVHTFSFIDILLIVSRVHEHKHLGLWLSHNLSWSRQISEVVNKANYKLAVLRSVKYLD